MKSLFKWQFQRELFTYSDPVDDHEVLGDELQYVGERKVANVGLIVYGQRGTDSVSCFIQEK
jgi:hypothetical protein